ncbi:baseplate assembly protein [Aurantimonas phage AmM-1]|uniref:baseplate assembly protein n=1 Tax=Aurantimonas phage AmM-1 TaxID=1503929 RepID=UPI000540FCD7|nr:baseplate assembly protein [Aurantimonas phage AmM-1]BAP94468.1 baseplate assembly protein [Aurantimonas phage AmM-1]
MISDLLALRSDLEQMKTLFGHMMRVGPVEVIDAVKGYRLKLGDGEDGPFLSPWYPHPETGKTSVPLKKGQVVAVLNPSGDPRQGVPIRGGYSDGHPSPNQNMEANVFQDAGVRLEVVDGKLTLNADADVDFVIGANIRFVVPRFDVNP